MLSGQRLNILGVGPYTRFPGHFEWFSTRVCQSLMERGHQATLLTYGGLRSPRASFPKELEILDAAPGWTGHAGREPPLTSGRRRLAIQWRTFSRAISQVRKGDYELAHFFDFHPVVLWLALSTRRLNGAACRTTLAANLHFAEPLQPARGLLRNAYRAIYRRALRSLIRRHLGTLFVLDSALKRGVEESLSLAPTEAGRIQTLTLGMDARPAVIGREEARARLGIDPGKTVFLLFGLLRKDKRPDLAIEAVAGLAGCQLVIAGAPVDWNARTLRRLVRQSSAAENVRLELGYAGEERMRDLFLASDAVLLPYARSFQGQSGVLSWACTYGRCVIASDTGGVGETVRGNNLGFAVEPDDAQALRGALARFLEAPAEERAALESHARDLASRSSWGAVGQELEKSYRAALASVGAARRLASGSRAELLEGPRASGQSRTERKRRPNLQKTVTIDARMLSATGIGTYLTNLLRNLAEMESEFRFRILCSPKGPPAGFPVDAFETVLARSPVFTLREQAEIFRLVRGTDLLHCPHYNIPYLFGGRLVVTIHDLTHLVYTEFLPNRLAYVYARIMLGAAARHARRVVTVSEFSKNTLRGRLGVPEEKIRVIYNGLADALACEQAGAAQLGTLPVKPPFILYVGMLKAHKNLRGLLRGFAQLPPALREEYQVVMVGEKKDEYAPLQQLARQLGIGRQVVFTGRVDTATLNALYGATTAFVLPSFNEGFGLTALEAMSHGVPVVASDNSSLPEVVGTAGVFVSPLDDRSLTSALERLLSDAGLRRELGQRGRERARLFSARESARRHLEVYREALA